MVECFALLAQVGGPEFECCDVQVQKIIIRLLVDEFDPLQKRFLIYKRFRIFVSLLGSANSVTISDQIILKTY